MAVGDTSCLNVISSNPDPLPHSITRSLPKLSPLPRYSRLLTRFMSHLTINKYRELAGYLLSSPYHDKEATGTEHGSRK
jgi:hypothetical protein